MGPEQRDPDESGAGAAGGWIRRAGDGKQPVSRADVHTHSLCTDGVRLRDAPEFARNFIEPGPQGEWAVERDRERLIAMLNESAKTVRDAVKGRIAAGRQMDVHYDHPILMLQHMIWHEGYHHGQIKLALKLAGTPLANKDIGSLTWRVWMQKKSPNPLQRP